MILMDLIVMDHYLSILRKFFFLSHDIAGKFVHCNLTLYLEAQCVKDIPTCHAKSCINTKVVIVLPD